MAERIKYTDSKPSPQMATGTVLPLKTPAAMEYLDNVRDFNKTQMWDIKKIMTLCKKLYYYGGQISTAIDILTEFPVTDFNIENVNNKKCKNILQHFKTQVNKNNPNALPGLYPLLGKIALDYFLCGNAFVYEVWSQEKDPAHKINISANLPMQMTVLNPLIMDVPIEYINMGQRLIFMELDREIVRIVRKKKRTQEEEYLISFLSQDIINQINSPKWKGKILVDNKFITQLRRKGQDYDAWGIPYLTKAFAAAATLQRLRLLDDATIEGLINYITIFRIGDPDNAATWSQERLQAFARMMGNPAASNYIVWSYDIDVITTSPEGKILDMGDKYKQANYDILGSLGIPEILFTGTGSQAGVWTAVLAMLERLEKFRDELQVYLETLLRKICLQNGYDDEFPQVRWHRMSLRDDNAVKNIVLSLYDRGLIPKQAVITEFGYNYDTFRQMRKNEKIEGDDEIFTNPTIPFSSPANEKQKPNVDRTKNKNKSEPTSDDGRPPVTTKKDSAAELSIEVVKELISNNLNDIKANLKNKIDEGIFIGDVEVASVIGTAYVGVINNIEDSISTIVAVANHMVDNLEFDCDGRDVRLEIHNSIEHLRNDCITKTIALTKRYNTEEISNDEYLGEIDSLLVLSKDNLNETIALLSVFEKETNEKVNRILFGGNNT